MGWWEVDLRIIFKKNLGWIFLWRMNNCVKVQNVRVYRDVYTNEPGEWHEPQKKIIYKNRIWLGLVVWIGGTCWYKRHVTRKTTKCCWHMFPICNLYYYCIYKTTKCCWQMFPILKFAICIVAGKMSYPPSFNKTLRYLRFLDGTREVHKTRKLK